MEEKQDINIVFTSNNEVSRYNFTYANEIYTSIKLNGNIEPHYYFLIKNSENSEIILNLEGMIIHNYDKIGIEDEAKKLFNDGIVEEICGVIETGANWVKYSDERTKDNLFSRLEVNREYYNGLYSFLKEQKGLDELNKLQDITGENIENTNYPTVLFSNPKLDNHTFLDILSNKFDKILLDTNCKYQIRERVDEKFYSVKEDLTRSIMRLNGEYIEEFAKEVKYNKRTNFCKKLDYDVYSLK